VVYVGESRPLGCPSLTGVKDASVERCIATKRCSDAMTQLAFTCGQREDRDYRSYVIVVWSFIQERSLAWRCGNRGSRCRAGMTIFTIIVASCSETNATSKVRRDEICTASSLST